MLQLIFLMALLFINKDAFGDSSENKSLDKCQYPSSVYIPRQATFDPVYQYALNYEKKNITNKDWKYFFSASLFGTKSTGKNLDNYFNIDKKNELQVREDGTGDIDSLWFKVISSIVPFTFYSSKLNMHPQRSTFGALLGFDVNLSDYCNNTRLEFFTSIINARHKINLCESFVPGSNGARDYSGTGILSKYKDMKESFNDDERIYGKISSRTLKKTGLDDIQIKLMKLFEHQENQHSVYLLFGIPTGSGTRSQYLFEPLVGSKHFNLGIGGTFNKNITNVFSKRKKPATPLVESDVPSSDALSAEPVEQTSEAAEKIEHLKQLSQEELSKEISGMDSKELVETLAELKKRNAQSAPVKPINTKISDTENETYSLNLLGEFKLRYAFKGKERRSFDLKENGQWSRYLLVVDQSDKNAPFFATNALSLEANVTPKANIDAWLALNYRKCDKFNLEAGYNFCFRQKEKVSLLNKSCPDFGNIGVADLIGIAREVNQQSASTAKLSQSVMPGNNQVKSDANFVSIDLTDLNLDSASQPKIISHKFYISGGYNLCLGGYDAEITLNTSYEFSPSRRALNQVAFWAGINFLF